MLSVALNVTLSVSNGTSRSQSLFRTCMSDWKYFKCQYSIKSICKSVNGYTKAKGYMFLSFYYGLIQNLRRTVQLMHETGGLGQGCYVFNDEKIYECWPSFGFMFVILLFQ